MIQNSEVDQSTAFANRMIIPNVFPPVYLKRCRSFLVKRRQVPMILVTDFFRAVSQRRQVLHHIHLVHLFASQCFHTSSIQVHKLIYKQRLAGPETIQPCLPTASNPSEKGSRFVLYSPQNGTNWIFFDLCRFF